MKKSKCPQCLGTGIVQDQERTGSALKRKRTVSLREAADCIGVSASHLCLLESGKRRWTPELIEKYQECCR